MYRYVMSIDGYRSVYYFRSAEEAVQFMYEMWVEEGSVVLIENIREADVDFILADPEIDCYYSYEVAAGILFPGIHFTKTAEIEELLRLYNFI